MEIYLLMAAAAAYGITAGACSYWDMVCELENKSDLFYWRACVTGNAQLSLNYTNKEISKCQTNT